MPPGFASIPLNNGKPIASSSLAPVSKPSTQRASSSSLNVHKKQEEPEIVEDDDDIINMLEQEIDDNDDDIEVDPEEEKFNHLINSATKHIPKLDKVLPKGAIPEDDLESQLSAFRIPDGNRAKGKQQAPLQPPAQLDRRSKSPNAAVQPKPQIQPQQSSVRPMPAGAQAKKPLSKELQVILERQRLFKEAALKAKQDGNVNVALVYLRHAKVRFDLKTKKILC